MISNDQFVKHQQRVIHVLERLFGCIEYKAAVHWMIWVNQELGNRKPIDMIDDDQQYERLLGALNELEEGRPS